jgi:hypothetical protein
MTKTMKKVKKLNLGRIFTIPFLFIGLTFMYANLFSQDLQLKNYIADVKNDKTSIAFPKIRESITRDWDNAIRNGSVSSLSYSDGNVSEAEVRDDLIRTINYHGNMNAWKLSDIKAVTQALQFGHNHKDFRINYKVALAIMSIESEMNPYATGHNTNGTTDYGLGQHNSCCILTRYAQAVRLEREYKISTVRSATMDRYDPLTNAISTLLYLRDNRTAFEQVAKTNKKFIPLKTVVVAYNRGFNGALYVGNEQVKYFDKFMVVYSRLN